MQPLQLSQGLAFTQGCTRVDCIISKLAWNVALVGYGSYSQLCVQVIAIARLGYHPKGELTLIKLNI